MAKIPSYTTVRLRECLARYSWLAVPVLIALGAAWLLGDPRLAMAAVLLIFPLALFIWTRVWVSLCSAPQSPLWRMTPEWHSEPIDGILLSVVFTGHEQESRRLDLRPNDIQRTADHGTYLLLYLKSEPGLLIVPTDEITPELRNKLLE